MAERPEQDTFSHWFLARSPDMVLELAEWFLLKLPNDFSAGVNAGRLPFHSICARCDRAYNGSSWLEAILGRTQHGQLLTVSGLLPQAYSLEPSSGTVWFHLCPRCSDILERWAAQHPLPPLRRIR